jgi:hypothetical protein
MAARLKLAARERSPVRPEWKEAVDRVVAARMALDGASVRVFRPHHRSPAHPGDPSFIVPASLPEGRAIVKATRNLLSAFGR